MKTIALALFAAAALPLLADEPQKTAPATTTAAPAATTPDSPLVAASKAKTKKSTAKKAIVITNDNLKKDGHITTNQTPSAPLPKVERKGLTPEQEADLRAREELDRKLAADKAAKEKADHDRRMAAANREIEGDTPESLYDDPAEVEHRAETQTQQKQQDQKPPM